MTENLVSEECHSGDTGAYRSAKHERWIWADVTYVVKWWIFAWLFVLNCFQLLGSINFSLIETLNFLHQLIFRTVTRCDYLPWQETKWVDVKRDKYHEEEELHWQKHWFYGDAKSRCSLDKKKQNRTSNKLTYKQKKGP